jgi:hypothetical protein
MISVTEKGSADQLYSSADGRKLRFVVFAGSLLETSRFVFENPESDATDQAV